MSDIEDRTLSLRQAAKLLRMSHSHLSRLVYENDGPLPSNCTREQFKLSTKGATFSLLSLVSWLCERREELARFKRNRSKLNEEAQKKKRCRSLLCADEKHELRRKIHLASRILQQGE